MTDEEYRQYEKQLQEEGYMCKACGKVRIWTADLCAECAKDNDPFPYDDYQVDLWDNDDD